MNEPRRLELIGFVINLITGVLLIRYWGWAPFLLAVVMVLGQMVISAYRYNSWRRTVDKAGAVLDENIRLKRAYDAAHAGDKTAEQKALTEALDNGTAIAKFLAGANPNWTEGSLQGALAMHVNDHKMQVDQMMANAPAAEQAKSWTEMQQHMDMIADVLSDGIAKQFPDKAD